LVEDMVEARLRIRGLEMKLVVYSSRVYAGSIQMHV
jgi:hypothetical protein